MNDILKQLPTSAIGWISLIIAGMLGVFALIDRIQRVRAKRADELDGELIAKLERNLEETQKELTHVHNNQLQKKALDIEVEKARALEEKRKAEYIANLTGKYETVEAILQGRNKEMDTVISQAPNIFATALDSNKIARETQELVKNLMAGQIALNESVTKLVEAMNK